MDDDVMVTMASPRLDEPEIEPEDADVLDEDDDTEPEEVDE